MFAFGGLSETVRFLEGKGAPCQTAGVEALSEDHGSALDFADVKGQDELIEAAVLATAGGHNMLRE